MNSTKESGSDAQDSNIEAIQCPYCQSDLAAPDVRFCTECNHWLDFAGHFWSQVKIGDIALYGSIVVLLFSSFSTLAFGERASIEANVIACSGFTATAYISNSGTAAGIITKATLRTEVPNTVGFSIASDFIKTDGSSDHRTISPDTGHLFRLSIADNDRSALLDGFSPMNQACVIRSDISAIIDSEATLKSIPLVGSCPCADFVRP